MYQVGNTFSDFFAGTPEDDIFDGQGGSDTLSGLDGADRLYGGTGDDTLRGDNGNDLLYGEDGNDQLRGGAGADTLDGGLGYDTVSYVDATGSVVLDLAAVGTLGDAVGDRFVSIEAIEGSQYTDVITGNAFATTFIDSFGSDRLIGRAAGGDTYRAFAENVSGVFRGVEIAFGARAAELAGQGGIALPAGAGIAVRVRTSGASEYDVLQGMDNFAGSLGNDIITGNGGANVIQGGDGNDTLDGGAGFDFVSYLEGFSAAVVNLDTGVATSNTYTDQLSRFEGVIGSISNDSITGGDGAERLQGEAGNDVISGHGGNDHLLGGPGSDALVGDAGNDILEGGDGADLFDGGAGSDHASYLNSPDGVYVDLLTRSGLQLVGHPSGHSLGDRYISIEQVTGSKYDDYVQGDNAANTIEGLDGDDELDGCGGNDTIYGDYSPNHNPGFAAPVLATGSHADEECMDCDDGEHTGGEVVLSGAALNAPSSANWNDEISGGDGDDRLYGQAGSDLLTGDCGNDQLFGGAQVDALFGGEDDDVLEGGASFDILFGGEGFDVASYASSASGVNANLAEFWSNSGGDANSSLITELIGIVSADDDVDAIFDNAIFAGLLAQLNDQAFELANLFKIPDVYFGIEGLEGSRFNDVLIGSGGTNTLEGGAGNDRLDGRAGEDTALYASAASAVTASLVTDNSSGGAGTDTLVSIENLTGSAFGDRLAGDDADNVLNGGAGADNLIGGAGSDTLAGGSGNDVLLGGTGGDILRGQAGADRLTGDFGADRFDFDSVGDSGLATLTRDVITDFLRAQGDRVDLSTIDANTALAGSQAFTFIGAAAFVGNSAGKLRFDAANHLILGSTDADTAAEFSIQVSGINSMLASDFIL